MSEADAPGFEAASDRTLYWTLSLYIRPEKLWRDERRTKEKGLIPARYDRDRIAEMRQGEPVSLALRNAVEPLFNDISDRESGGAAIDFLLAAHPDAAEGREDEAARNYEDIAFHPPSQVAWTTEGRRFVATMEGLKTPRPARRRRFWFVHANGAISWHLALTLGYRHDPADYLFLAMLQKLAAPKEFSVDHKLMASREQPDGSKPAGKHRKTISVFEDRDCGIDPLDKMLISIGRDPKQRRFWPAVKDMFDADVKNLVERLAEAHHCAVPSGDMPELLDQTGLIEVPGLVMPRCRTMMFFRDARFFERLSPHFDREGNSMPRRLLVQDPCYAPYSERLAAITGTGGGKDASLDEAYWQWVRTRPDPEYDGLTADDWIAIREGRYAEPDGTIIHIPTAEPHRSDCMDYLFLAGFNQNIIDFMNQDTSEILDGTDPIYPTDEEQAREGFFVRFANHRSMITYAASSRSLEVGNDYIGTCPYAFLIHVLSMHNEFLARDFEATAIARLGEIEEALATRTDHTDFAELSGQINALKIARYRDYEQHRYVNVFRYDTERDVFAQLEQLRGVQRKETALELALGSLEDYARDLESQRSSERDRNIGAIGFVLSALILAQGFDMLADISEKYRLSPWLQPWLTDFLRSTAAALLVLLIATGIWLIIGRFRAIVELLKPRAKSDAPDRPQQPDNS